jgi:hypothetical protein
MPTTEEGAGVTTVLTRAAEPDAREGVRPDGGLVLVGTAPGPQPDLVDQWGMHSFPASDPPANW